MSMYKSANPIALQTLRKIEAYLFLISLIPAVIYAFSDSPMTGFLVFLSCFLVPQPFLIYALWKVLFPRSSP